MRRLVAVVWACAVLAGCAASVHDTAVKSANGARSAGEVWASLLHDRCTERYKKAKAEEVPAIDVRCVPIERAYDAFRDAHAALVAAIVAVESGAAPETLGPALSRMAKAAQAIAALGGAP